MASNTFSVGRDGTAIIQHPLSPNGGRLDLRHITGFRASPSYSQLASISLKGITRTRAVPKGWGGEFDVDRGDQSVDLFCTALEEAYFNGLPFVYGTITVYIQEQDGSVSSFLFEDADLWVSDAGSYMADQVVKQKISFAAPRRRLV